MGKKSKKTAEAKSAAATRNVKRDTLDIVNELLKLCSQPLGNGNLEWPSFLVIYELIKKLQEVQKGHEIHRPNREQNFNTFITWLHENNVNTDFVEIAAFDEGYGLKAKKNIKAAELFLRVPRNLMLTTETAEASCLGPIIEEDLILKAMPNIVMALQVLCEAMSPNSFWKPYIDILPSSYTTPLYFTLDELQLLKGSPAQSDVLNMFRNIGRQYAYFFLLFHNRSNKETLPLNDFTFADYRWAVSTVMTRQNQIPSSDGKMAISGLIPLWDMCNHSVGDLSTDYNTEEKTSECFAFRDFEKDEQIFIFYGSRSNADLLLHNGFVYPSSHCDRMRLNLGVSKNDPLYSKKSQLLAKMNILPSRNYFYLHHNEDPVDSELLTFLRVFNMTDDDLEARLNGEKAKELQRDVRDFADLVSEENEIKSWSFLATRIALLLRNYENIGPSEVDAGASCESLVLSLRQCEKRILIKSKNYAERRIEKVKNKENLAPISTGSITEEISLLDLEESQVEVDAAVNGISVN